MRKNHWFGLVLVVAATILSGCTGHTTSATKISQSTANLKATVSCDGGSCYYFFRIREAGNASTTRTTSLHGPFAVRVVNVPIEEPVSQLKSGTTYQYQLCGWGDGIKQANTVCMGPDGPDSWQTFSTSRAATVVAPLATQPVTAPVVHHVAAPVVKPVAAPVAPRVAAPESSAVVLTPNGTDNYKARWNANPNVRDNRAWLQLFSIKTGSTTWVAAPIANGGTIEILPSSSSLPLQNATNSSVKASMRISAISGPTTMLTLRHDKQDNAFGPLVGLGSLAALKAAPARWSVTIQDARGVTIGTSTIEYRYEDAIANAPVSSIEHNGPGGRFWVNGATTRLIP